MQFWATGKSRAGIAVVFAVFLAGCGGTESDSGSNVPSTPPAQESVSTDQTVSLSWHPPMARINGEDISPSDIDGYIVRYGQDPGNLDQQAVLEGCQSPQCYYEVENLVPGTWYFTVQAVDNNGLISSPSQPVSRAI